MSSANAWAKAYKEIHGKTPTKNDMRTVAPASVKRNIFGTENLPVTPEKGSRSSNRPVSLSLKRPEGPFMPGSLGRVRKRKLFDPEGKPPTPKRKAVDPDDKPSSPERKEVEPERKPLTPKRKAVEKERKPLTPKRKPEGKPLTPKKVALLRSPFKVFSPHKLPNATIASISPLKRFNARNARALFASPEKPVQEVTLTNVSYFIEQEERANEEEKEEVVEDMFEDQTQTIEEEHPGLLEKEAKWNPVRKPTTEFRAKPKKDNFVRLNMKKKTFVRGQTSASSKRKKLFRHKRNRLA